MAWKDLQWCNMKALVTAAAKWFAAFVILLDAVLGSPLGCAKGQYRDQDSHDCMRCPYCPQKYWSSGKFYREGCAYNNTEPVMIEGSEYRSWCMPGTPHAFYDVCEFPEEVQGLVSCANGPRYGNQCNLTCEDGQVYPFICQSNSSQYVTKHCKPIDASTPAGLPPSTTTAPHGAEGAGDRQQTTVIAVTTSLTFFVLLMVVLVWKCYYKGRKPNGSKENLTVKIDSDGSSTSSAASEPSASDSLLADNKKEDEEEKQKADKDARCCIIEMNSTGASTGLRDPVCYEAVSSQPESLPPPYTSSPQPYGACVTNHLQGQMAGGDTPDDSMTVPKERVGPGTPPVCDQTPRSHRVQMVSGLEGTGPGDKAVLMSSESPPPYFPTLSGVSEMTEPEPEPAMNPEDCSHQVTLLFTRPQLRELLADLKLELEPVDRKDPSLTMIGLSMHCLQWSQMKADNIRWARRENLQESPAHVTLASMSEEGLTLGHIALYFSNRSHRNRKIVELLKSAETHQQCPFCSREGTYASATSLHSVAASTVEKTLPGTAPVRGELLNKGKERMWRVKWQGEERCNPWRDRKLWKDSIALNCNCYDGDCYSRTGLHSCSCVYPDDNSRARFHGRATPAESSASLLSHSLPAPLSPEHQLGT